jgi:hypothetical protein
MSNLRNSLFVACLLLIGCQPASEPKSVPLAIGVSSYISPQQAQQRIGAKAQNWEVLEDTKNDRNDRRPAYHRYVVVVAGISDHGEMGTARLHFFNERLSSVWFYPDKPNEYQRKLGGNSSGVIVRLGKDHLGRFYVAFDDPVLEGEHSDWIKRNT